MIGADDKVLQRNPVLPGAYGRLCRDCIYGETVRPLADSADPPATFCTFEKKYRNGGIPPSSLFGIDTEEGQRLPEFLDGDGCARISVAERCRRYAKK